MAARVARPSVGRLPAVACALVVVRLAVPRLFALPATRRLILAAVARHARRGARRH